MDITFLKSLYASIYLFFSYYGLHTVQAFFLFTFGVAKYATTPNDFRQLAECYPGQSIFIFYNK
jgi:hypothetical protein